MQAKLKRFFENTSNRWGNLEKQQKIKLILTALIVLITLSLSIYFVTKPKRIVLIQNLDTATLVKIQNELNSAGIYNRPIRNSTAIEILRRDKNSAIIQIEQSNVGSQLTFTYEDAINLSGIGSTETIKSSNLIRAHSFELADTLRNFVGVENARVTLHVPQSTNFLLDAQNISTASVFLSVNREFDSSSGETIARFISRSTDGLETENIEIVDQFANVIFSGMQGSLREGRRSDSEQLVRQDMHNSIQSFLGPLYDEVQIISNLRFNWDQGQVQSEIFEPPIAGSDLGGILNQSIQTSRVEGVGADAEVGLGANNQTGYQMGEGQNFSANERMENTEFIWNRETQVRELGAVGLMGEESNLSIMAYTYVTFYENDLINSDQLQGMTWDDFKASQAPTEIDVNQNVVDNIRNGTGINSLTVVAYEVPVFFDAESTPLQIAPIIMFGILAVLISLLAYGLFRKSIEDEVTEIEPEVAVEELLVSNKIEESEEEKELRDISLNADSEVKRQLEKFISEKPDAVAQLLRNWLSDGWE